MGALILPAIAGLFGAAIGSFLNVCIYRWPADESVVFPASSCTECGGGIAWHDNIPVLGWVLLAGRCRRCEEQIPIFYPLVEAATALVWIAAFLRYGVSWQALSAAIFFTLLIGIATTDARTYIIPDQFSLGGLGIGLLLSFAPGGITPGQAITGAMLGFGFLYLAALFGEWVFRRQAMGGGDIKMMAMIGAFLGPTNTFVALFFGALIGSLVFLPSLRSGKLVPFGVFLAIGAGITEVWGEAILGWYTGGYLG